MRKNAILVWLLLLGMLFAAFFLMDPSRNRPEEVALSEFIVRVEAGEIRDVSITGDQVRGTSGARTVTTYASDKTELIRAMHEHHVAFREDPPPQTGQWIGLLLKLGLPILLLVLFVRMLQNAQGGGKALKQVTSSKAELHRDVKVTFSDVAGADEAVEEVKDLVDYLRDPGKFARLGGKVSKGVLLIGESGCGKTLLARAVAGEAGVPFFAVSAASFVEMFVGVGAARVRDLFENGKKHRPCILFIDEIDAVGKSRGGLTVGGGHDEREQTLNELLIQMDGFAQNDGVLIMAATNRPEILDSALLRPGRFNRRVVVPRPDLKGRAAILKVHAKNKPLAPDVDFSIVARGTTGMTGADLENLLNEAALGAAKAGRDAISAEDIMQARDKVIMGPERKGVVFSDEEKRVVATHEAGHTVAGWFTPGADPPHRVTIIPRGMALGLTWSLPETERKLYKRSELLAQIKGLFGGRVAEEMILGDDFTTGASNDLQRLTAIARGMITDYGMSESLGQRTFGDKQRGFVFENEQRDYGDETATAIDREIKKLVDRCHEEVKKLITDKRAKLDALTAELIEKETLDDADLLRILGPRPATA